MLSHLIISIALAVSFNHKLTPFFLLLNFGNIILLSSQVTNFNMINSDQSFIVYGADPPIPLGAWLRR